MTKVLLVSNSAKGEFTGRRQWAERLSSSGWLAVFALPKEESYYIRKFEECRIPVLPWEVRRQHHTLRNTIAATYSLYKIPERTEFDVVHASGHEANIYTSAAACLAGKTLSP